MAIQFGYVTLFAVAFPAAPAAALFNNVIEARTDLVKVTPISHLFPTHFPHPSPLISATSVSIAANFSEKILTVNSC